MSEEVAETLAADIAASGALQAEVEALAGRMAVAEAREVAEVNPAGAIVPRGSDPRTGRPVGPTVVENVRLVEADAERLARRANRKLARAGASRDDEGIVAAKRSWLDSRLEGWEREHAAHAARRAEREAALRLDGDDAPDDEDRARLVKAVAENVRAMRIIDAVHAAALAELAALPEPEPEPTEPTEPE